MTDRELLAAFESGRIEPGAFCHAEHVRTAWLCLQREEPAAALGRYVDSIRRRAPVRYHETITWAYVLLIRERMEPGGEWGAFARRNPDLMDWQQPLLHRYYSPELLASQRARERFVWPDRGAES